MTEREEGYREAYDSGIKALGDMAVEVHRLVSEAEEKLEELKAQALDVVHLVEGRAEGARSLLEVRPPEHPHGVMTAADRLRKAAREDCPDCRGSGLYGQECVCLCVNSDYYSKETKDRLNARQ